MAGPEGINIQEQLALQNKALEAIDSASNELFELNQKIWRKPELAYQEKYAHEVVTSYLEKKGFAVTRHYSLETAFRAESEGGLGSEGLTVGVMCEYDALENIGHACGHNLIAEAGVATGIGIRAALDSMDKKLGKVIIFGTPAEEMGGGKVKMIDSGCFKDADICLMLHPCPTDMGTVHHSEQSAARTLLTATFKGHASHATCFPWKGINALDAAVSTYQNLSMMRQQLKPMWRVNVIISNGGVRPTVIPQTSELRLLMATPTRTELEILNSKVKACVEASASATGCEVVLDWGNTYFDLISIPVLEDLYAKRAAEQGVKFPKPEELDAEDKYIIGCTDMGNVSYVKPSIHPMIALNTKAGIHSREFMPVAGTHESHETIIRAAKAMALTAIDVLCNEDLKKKVGEDFKNGLERSAQGKK